MKKTMTKEFRQYQNDDKVAKFYLLNHQHQTYELAKDKYSSLNGAKMSIWSALDMMNTIIDDSDPDLNQAQIIHCFQTAEAIRKAHPTDESLQVVGLVHDLGKIMIPLYDIKDYLAVGDTYPLGLAFSDKIIYYPFFESNPDWSNPVYSSKYGIYSPNIGFENVTFSSSHDEYFYQVCVNNHCLLPDYALYTIRFHSFYAWHQHQAYDYIANDKDWAMLKYLQLFQKFDLYSKCSDTIDIEKLKVYYTPLIDKYFPSIMEW